MKENGFKTNDLGTIFENAKEFAIDSPPPRSRVRNGNRRSRENFPNFRRMIVNLFLKNIFRPIELPTYSKSSEFGVLIRSHSTAIAVDFGRTKFG